MRIIIVRSREKCRFHLVNDCLYIYIYPSLAAVSDVFKDTFKKNNFNRMTAAAAAGVVMLVVLELKVGKTLRKRPPMD